MSESDFLVDVNDGSQRFRVLGLLANGRSYQLVGVEDTRSEGGCTQTLCARAVLYDTGYSTDADYVRVRREAVREEWRFLEKMNSPLLPKPVALIDVETDPELMPDVEGAGLATNDAPVEPVLVCDWQEGLTIFEWIRREHPEGLPGDQALQLLGEVVEFLKGVHDIRYIFRDLDPRHFIVGPVDTRDLDAANTEVGAHDEAETSSPKMTLTRVVGFGNATPIGERPNQAKFHYNQSPYVAPEVRGDRSGTMLRTGADSYALGALLSFILTGEEPRTVVENPLGQIAYERLSNLDPPGLSLLVARLIQPHGKNRIARMERLAKYTTRQTLPTTQTKGFGMLLLPAPYSGVEDPKNNRALHSKLSAGPLISTVHDPKNMAGESMSEAENIDEDQWVIREPMPLSWSLTAAALGLVSVAALILLGVI